MRETKGSKGSGRKGGRATHIGGLPGEYNTMVIWETRNCGPKVRETTYLTRKPGNEEKSGLQEEKVVSHCEAPEKCFLFKNPNV